MTALTAADAGYLTRTIELSRQALADRHKTPFGAVVVIGGRIAGEGTSSVVELHDPTAHAEIMALRAAAQAARSHLLPGAVLYCSSQPCPMCLIAGYWARVARVVYAATFTDAAGCGFEDLQLYRQLARPAGQRDLPEISAGDPLRASAAGVLRQWADSFPGPVTPRY